MNELVNSASIGIDNIEFDYEDNDWQSIEKTADDNWEYNYGLDADKYPHGELPDKESIQCTARIVCYQITPAERKKVFTIGATTWFSIDRLERHEVDATLLAYLLETNYNHLRGHLVFKAHGTPMQTNSLPYIDFASQNNIDKILDKLWQ